MKILALQLKRIGDLVLTTPALKAMKAAWPGAHVMLGVMDGTSGLLAAMPAADAGIVFGRGRGFAPWQQVITGGWDLCFDFTGTDRSALATMLSRAKTRAAFEWVRKNKLRAFAYNTWSPSLVREVHTAQHYLDLVAQASSADRVAAVSLQPELALPRGRAGESRPTDGRPYALLHAGTARPEKYWVAERWAEVARHLREAHGLEPVFSCGPDAFEKAHVAEIGKRASNTEHPMPNIQYPADLSALAALVAGARMVVSCDTAVVHLAAAFSIPQIALFGPTNPFHWRPMHDRAVVLSAAQPEAPLTEFTPRMKGAATDRISTAVVIRATDALLLLPELRTL